MQSRLFSTLLSVLLTKEAEGGRSAEVTEQDSTTVPKFAFRSFFPRGNLVGECLPQTLLMRPIRGRKEASAFEEKLQHAAPHPCGKNPHDRGRIRGVFRAAFPLRDQPGRVYPAGHPGAAYPPYYQSLPGQ